MWLTGTETQKRWEKMAVALGLPVGSGGRLALSGGDASLVSDEAFSAEQRKKG